MTKRRIRIRETAKARPREASPTALDPRDPEIVRAKELLYGAGRSRRAA